MIERLGVFGGTFDPPHVGHVAAAAQVRHDLDLDRVLLVVANIPWQKVGERPISDAADRLALVRAAVAGIDGLEASELEIRRGGTSYTVDTLRDLAAGAVRELHLILGADAAAGIETWQEPDAVRDLAVPVVVHRPGAHPPLPARWSWVQVEVAALDVSSTDLRERVRSGHPIDGLVPRAAVEVIRARHLYRGDL